MLSDLSGLRFCTYLYGGLCSCLRVLPSLNALYLQQYCGCFIGGHRICDDLIVLFHGGRPLPVLVPLHSFMGQG